MASSYSRRNRSRFTFDQKRAQVRRLCYCALSHPLPIEDDWHKYAPDADKCKITIYAFEGTPNNIADMDAYGNTMTHQFYGHIVEVEVDCWSRFRHDTQIYLVKDQFPSRDEAREFADAIPEPVSYEYLKDNGFQ